MEKDDEIETNKKLLIRSGLILGENWTQNLYSVVSVAIVLCGALHYAGKLVTGETPDVAAMVQNLHLVNGYIVSGVSGLLIILESKNFYTCHNLIKSGFFTYSIPLSTEQLLLITNINRKIKKLSKHVPRLFLLMVFSSVVKEPVPHDFEKWTKEYRGWFPFKIDSWPRYIVGQGFHVVVATFVTLFISSFLMVFLTFAEHLIVQLKILGLQLEYVFKLHESKVMTRETEEQLHNHMSECIKHQYIILRFFESFKTYYSKQLLSILTGTALAMCTLAFVLTDDNVTVKVVTGFFVLLLPEILVSFTYCVYGQLVTNTSEMLREIIYGLYWYNHSTKIKLALLLMLTKTRKPLVLTCYGMKDCSLATFKDMLQASYTYFNVLQAVNE